MVIEISYQDLYVDRLRPLYKFEKNHYWRAGEIKAVSLRPYRIVLREDKTVNPNDLRLEQLSYFIEKSRRIQEKWKQEKKMQETTLEEWL